jgi:4-amino-4-deoxy-L-arabinose transferase-like glycosyltransferase
VRSKPLLAILAVALLVRVGAIALTPDYVPLFDAADFHRIAASIADGNGYPPPQLGTEGPTAFRPPAYPTALAVAQVLGLGLTAERLLGALFGVLTVLLLYLVALRIWGPRVAAASGAIAALFPPLVFLSATVLSEVLFVPLVLASVLAVLRYRDDRRLRWAAAAGLFCGLAALTRTVGLPIALALAAGVWVARPRLRRAALVPPLVVLVATFATIAPWMARNALAFDRYVGLSTAAPYALAATYNEEARARAEHPGQPLVNAAATQRFVNAKRRVLDEAELMSRLDDRARDFMREHPGYVAQSVAWNVLRVFDLERHHGFKRVYQGQTLQALGASRLASPVLVLGSLYLVLVLALVGIAVEVRRRPRAPGFVWAVPVILLVPVLAIYALPRYRAPADPFLVMLAAVGAVAVWQRTRRVA